MADCGCSSTGCTGSAKMSCSTTCSSFCGYTCGSDGCTGEGCFSGSCYGSCSGTCSSTCADDCTYTCVGGCSAQCSDDCEGSCTLTCTGDCEGSCSAACADNCSGSCSGGCSGSCSGSCSGTAQGGCLDCSANCQSVANLNPIPVSEQWSWSSSFTIGHPIDITDTEWVNFLTYINTVRTHVGQSPITFDTSRITSEHSIIADDYNTAREAISSTLYSGDVGSETVLTQPISAFTTLSDAINESASKEILQ